MRWQNLGMRTGEVYHNRIRPDIEEAKANGIVALSVGYKAKLSLVILLFVRLSLFDALTNISPFKC